MPEYDSSKGAFNKESDNYIREGQPRSRGPYHDGNSGGGCVVLAFVLSSSTIYGVIELVRVVLA